jgi:DNA-binding NarL/FixJ family response regulator
MRGDRFKSENARCALHPRATGQLLALGRRGQVLQGMWDGKGTKEIAAELGISPKTVQFHRARLYRVFGVSDLVSLWRRALVMGVIRVEGQKQKSEMLKAKIGVGHR